MRDRSADASDERSSTRPCPRGARLPTGPAISTLSDVARAAGVSVQTVSNSIRHPHLLAPQTLERVQRASRALSFVPNGAARTLVGRPARAVGVLVPDLRDRWLVGLVAALDAAAWRRGLLVQVISAGEDEHRHLETVHLLRGLGVVAIVDLVATAARSDTAAGDHGLTEEQVTVLLDDALSAGSAGTG